ncbi:putative ribosomal RNA methyltransferase, partial [Stegodyphus mimosarum]
MLKQSFWVFRRERKNLQVFLLHHVRQISSSSPMRKTIPDNLKGKSKSSQEWLTRQLNDVYVKKCRYDRYRCRSAYKLLEIDEKYRILRPGLSVIDCGAAPGSWTQVVVRKMKLDSADEKKKGLVIAVDLQHIDPLKGAIILKNSDFTDLAVQDEICKLLPTGKADVILSDMAPKA